jgi:signal transduction histidine kinase/ActR/RegA family two-component response regulator
VDAGVDLFLGEEKSGASPHGSSKSREHLEDTNYQSADDGDHGSYLHLPPSTPSPEHAEDQGQPLNDQLDESAEILSAAIGAGHNKDTYRGLVKRAALKKCITRYPFGKCFYLNQGRILSEESCILDDTAPAMVSGTSKPNARKLPGSAIPSEILERIPDAKWLLFLPLFSSAQGRWVAAGFIWGDNYSKGDPDDALPYFKTFGSCMMSEIASMDVLNTNLAKSTFIASISHDMRSPLHGMLGSLEFLEETMTTAYQMSLVGAIETCGKTLLDTIDHVLDYAKINNLNRTSTRRTTQKRGKPTRLIAEVESSSQNGPRVVAFDMACLVEEVVEAVFAGQTFRKINLRSSNQNDEPEPNEKAIPKITASAEEQIHAGSAKFSGKVFFMLNIQDSKSWCLKGQPGALRRVIMNVVGNAIKYCSVGTIEITLNSKPLKKSNVEVEIIVNDTGIGMSQDFLDNHLFEAFVQEDSFTPGTGLGLAITSQIVKSLKGKIRIQSEKDVGTRVTIRFPMKVADPEACTYIRDDPLIHARKTTQGKRACFLTPPTRKESTNTQQSNLESSIMSICQNWFGMECIGSESVETDPPVSIYIYAEPPPIEYLTQQHIKRSNMGKSGKDAALLVICTNAFEASALRAAGIEELVSLGKVIEVISQPVGPRKLAKVFQQCLERVEASCRSGERPSLSKTLSPSLDRSAAQQQPVKVEVNTSSFAHNQPSSQYRHPLQATRPKPDLLPVRTPEQHQVPNEPPSRSGVMGTGAQSDDAISPSSDSHSDNPRPHAHLPRVLLVDDNAINLKLLVTFMKKIGLPYGEASNGLEALTRYKEAAGEPFDFILMDLQMPVMDGVESTRKIREFEREATPGRTSTIIAITGVANEAAREEAMGVGVTQFLTKPLRFRELQRILQE